MLADADHPFLLVFLAMASKNAAADEYVSDIDPVDVWLRVTGVVRDDGDDAHDASALAEPAPDVFTALAEAMLGRVDGGDVSDDQNAPPLSSYQEDAVKPSIVVDGEANFWKRGALEVDATCLRLRFVLGEQACSSESSALAGLVAELFGRNSRFVATLTRATSLPFATIARFVATTCVMAAYNESISSLTAPESRIALNGLLSTGDYVDVWRRVARAGRPADVATATSSWEKPLWQELEDDFNADARRLFSDGISVERVISIDDDKIHFGIQDKKERKPWLANLMLQFHAAKRRFGFTGHSAASVMTGLVLALCVQRASPEGWKMSTLECYKAVVEVLAPNGASMALYTCASDRAYCGWDTVRFLLSRGANVMNTVKRSKSVLYTYDQKLSGNDKRVLIDCDGYATVRTASVTVEGKALTLMAVRNGAGSVTLLRSSFLHGQQLSLVPLQRAASVSFARPRSTTVQYMPLVQALPVVFVTFFQATSLWFWMRSFSITSSSACRFLSHIRTSPIRAASSASDSWNFVEQLFAIGVGVGGGVGEGDGGDDDGDDDDDDDDEDDGDAVDRVEEAAAEDATRGMVAAAGAVGARARRPTARYGYEPPPAALVVAASNADADADADDAGDDADDTDAGADADNRDSDEEDINWPRQATVDIGNDATVTSYCDSSVVGELPRAHVFALAAAMGSTTTQLRTARAAIVKWCSASSKRRPFIFMKMEQLREQCRRQDVNAPSSASKESLIGLLSGDVGAASTALSKQLSPLDVVLHSTFMRKLEGKAAEYASLGHAFENVMVERLCRDSADDAVDTVFTVLDVFECGLVQRVGEPWLKDSIDRIVVVERAGGVSLAGLEVKTRVTGSTSTAALARHVREFGSDASKYQSVAAESPRFRALIDSRAEAVQLVHHAAVYGLKHVLLLVGDQVRVLFGYWVSFEPETLAHYRRVLHDLYRSVLLWAYDDTVPVPRDDIAAALARLPRGVDLQSFDYTLAVWRELERKEFPLPPTRKVLPMQVGFWNTFKGAADVATRVVSANDAPMPHGADVATPQSIVAKRIIMLGVANLHRALQLLSSRSSAAEFDSVRAFRNANNKRRSFHRTLLQVAGELTQLAEASSAGASAADDVAAAANDDSDDDDGDDDAAQRRVPSINLSRFGVEPRLPRIGSFPGSPARDVRAQYSQPQYAAAARRFNDCDGRVFRAVDKDGNPVRRTCFHCKQNGTSYWCGGCHNYFCLKQVKTTAQEKNAGLLERSTVVTASAFRVEGFEDMYVANSCYLMAHPKSGAALAATTSHSKRARRSSSGSSSSSSSSSSAT